jgi:hypothetical protein
MAKRAMLCLVATTALAAMGEAGVIWENRGSKAGFTDCSVQQQGEITEVASPVFVGPAALRMRQIYLGNTGTRYHAECIKRGIASRTDYYYGQAMWIPSNWVWHSQNHVWQQFATEDPGAPWLGNMIGGSGYHHLQYHFVRGPMSGSETDFADISGLRGTWMRVVLRIHQATAGHFEIWLNGTRRVSRTGDFSTAYAGNSSIRWSTGIYAAAWYRSTPTGPTDLSIWHDHLRIATTYSEAEPANWGGSGPTPTPVPTATPNPTTVPTATPTSAPTATPCAGCGFSGYYRITAKQSGKVVAVQGASTANAADVIQWAYGGAAANDEWELVDLGNGYHRVVNRHSGKVLNVAGVSTANGGNVDQWSWANVSQQQWQIADLGNGYHRLTARHSGKVLNVAGASTADGANVDQWSWANVSQQQFQLVSVP